MVLCICWGLPFDALCTCFSVTSVHCLYLSELLRQFVYMEYMSNFMSVLTLISAPFFCPLQCLLILAIRPWYFFLCIHWSIALLLHSARFSFQHAPQGMFRILRIRMSANSVSLNRSPLIQIGPYLWNIFLLVYIYMCNKLCVCTDAIMLTVRSQSCLENDTGDNNREVRVFF